LRTAIGAGEQCDDLINLALLLLFAETETVIWSNDNSYL